MPLSYRLLESGPVRLLESGSSLLMEASAATLAAAAAASAPGATDPTLYPDLVWLLPLTETVDVDGGPDESFPAPSGPGLPCTVTSKLRVRAGYSADQELGVTPVIVGFPTDPGAKKGDRLLWLGRTVRLLAPARPVAGAGSLYTAQGEIRD